MFRWCSYCQNLIGEAEPLSDYRVSHGVCDACSEDLESRSPSSDLPRARSISVMLDKAGRGGSLVDCEQVIFEALDFGLKPSDLIVGILQPALYRVGDLWQRGEIRVAEEHRFTAFALGLIDRLQFPHASADRPLIILATHPQSFHDVGVRMLQVLSWEHGIPCERILTGTDEPALLEVASARRPVMFGLSVSLMETVPVAVELARALASRLPERSTVVLGGQAFRRTERSVVPIGIRVLRSVDEFLVQLQALKDATSTDASMGSPT